MDGLVCNKDEASLSFAFAINAWGESLFNSKGRGGLVWFQMLCSDERAFHIAMSPFTSEAELSTSQDPFLSGGSGQVNTHCRSGFTARQPSAERDFKFITGERPHLQDSISPNSLTSNALISPKEPSTSLKSFHDQDSTAIFADLDSYLSWLQVYI